jgi:hypothetical protein
MSIFAERPRSNPGGKKGSEMVDPGGQLYDGDFRAFLLFSADFHAEHVVQA